MKSVIVVLTFFIYILATVKTADSLQCYFCQQCSASNLNTTTCAGNQTCFDATINAGFTVNEKGCIATCASLNSTDINFKCCNTDFCNGPTVNSTTNATNTTLFSTSTTTSTIVTSTKNSALAIKPTTVMTASILLSSISVAKLLFLFS